jgi:hypothetical protein
MQVFSKGVHFSLKKGGCRIRNAFFAGLKDYFEMSSAQIKNI